MTYEVRNIAGENCTNTRSGEHATYAAADRDLAEARRIRPDMVFSIVETSPFEHPDSVTHYYCPDHPHTGLDNSTHHLVKGRCQTCHKSEAELRKEHGL